MAAVQPCYAEADRLCFYIFTKRRELLYRAAYNMLFSALHYANGCGIMNLGIDNSEIKNIKGDKNAGGKKPL